jgi:acetyltransferase-like isoleucine patch superfamily enzyme
MNKSAGILEIEAGITVVHNGFERIFSSVPIHFGKGVSLANGAYIYCTGEGDDIYIGDDNTIGGELILFPGTRIGNHCSFGTGTIIVAGGFRIGNGCVLSHGCTITQDVPENLLVVGRRGLIFSK